MVYNLEELKQPLRKAGALAEKYRYTDAVKLIDEALGKLCTIMSRYQRVDGIPQELIDLQRDAKALRQD